MFCNGFGDDFNNYYVAFCMVYICCYLTVFISLLFCGFIGDWFPGCLFVFWFICFCILCLYGMC